MSGLFRARFYWILRFKKTGTQKKIHDPVFIFVSRHINFQGILKIFLAFLSWAYFILYANGIKFLHDLGRIRGFSKE